MWNFNKFAIMENVFIVWNNTFPFIILDFHVITIAFIFFLISN